jgi:hypothetical protein
MCVLQVREEEKNQRQDLFILATSYSGQLKAKSASMIRENDFHQVSDKVILCVLTKKLIWVFDIVIPCISLSLRLAFDAYMCLTMF